MDIRISIVLPTRNRGELLRAPLNSVCRQLREGDEIIVSINGEKEHAKALIESYRKIIHPAKLRIIQPDLELSIYRHWNYAIQQAKNPWIVFLHDDECYNHELLSTIRTEVEQNPALSLIVGGTVNLEINPSLKIWKKNEFAERRTIAGIKWISEQARAAAVNYSSTCYVFKKNNSYDFLSNETRVSDILLMFWQALEGEVLELPMIFGTHLLHATNQSWTDYLTLEQTPYWEGLIQVSALAGLEELKQMAEQEKNKAVTLYLRNATHAALPRCDSDGFRECLNQAKKAGASRAVLNLYSIICFNSLVFKALGKLSSKMKSNVGRSRFWKSTYADYTLSDTMLKSSLSLDDKEWDDFVKLAQKVSR